MHTDTERREEGRKKEGRRERERVCKNKHQQGREQREKDSRACSLICKGAERVRKAYQREMRTK